jgi:hypothetical protein
VFLTPGWTFHPGVCFLRVVHREIGFIRTVPKKAGFTKLCITAKLVESVI